MNAKTKYVGRAIGHSALVRPRYSPGLLLEDDDLRQAVDYTRELNRLLMRSLIGCGVVCGLAVKADERCGKLVVKVASGVALDCLGDPIHVPVAQPIDVDLGCVDDVPADTRLWVLLKRRDKTCAPRPALCGCDDDDEENGTVATRERDGYEIQIVKQRPRCVCGWLDAPAPDDERDDGDDGDQLARPAARDCLCADPRSPCYRDHYAGRCACDCGGPADDCDDEAEAAAGREPCECDWVLLARIDRLGGTTRTVWDVHHEVRCFVRPVLMRDPRPACDVKRRKPPSPPDPALVPDPALTPDSI